MASTTEEKKPKLMDQMREAMRVKHYSYQTEKSYLHWARRYIVFHDRRHPGELGPRRYEHFFHIWRWIATSRHQHRTRRSMPWSFSTSTYSTSSLASSMQFGLVARNDYRLYSPLTKPSGYWPC